MLTVSLTALAQVTTSGISGKVTANDEEVIGATIVKDLFGEHTDLWSKE